MADALVDVCERAGLQLLNVHAKKSSVGFREKWRVAFALPEVDWRGQEVEWGVLGTHLAPALVRRAAIRRYNEARFEAATAFIAKSLNFAEVYEVRGLLPDHGWLRQEIGPNDLYIIEGDWRWSFVMTHEEEGLGIGPFFVDRLIDAA